MPLKTLLLNILKQIGMCNLTVHLSAGHTINKLIY